MTETGEPGRHIVAVDVICLTVRDHQLHVLLARRDRPPFQGDYALPGSVVGNNESLDGAAHRTFSERTRLEPGYLEQLYTFDGVADPRGPRISVAYYMLRPDEPDRRDRDRDLVWMPVAGLPTLPFDHNLMVHYARHRLQAKLLYTPIVFRLLPESFTLTDLRQAHEAIEEQRYPHATNFQTQMLRRWSLAKTGELSRRSQKPANLYRYVGPHEIGGPPPERTLDGTEHQRLA